MQYGQFVSRHRNEVTKGLKINGYSLYENIVHYPGHGYYIPAKKANTPELNKGTEVMAKCFAVFFVSEDGAADNIFGPLSSAYECVERIKNRIEALEFVNGQTNMES